MHIAYMIRSFRFALVWCAVIGVARGADASVADAHEKVALFKQELKAASDAGQAGDQAGAAKHEGAAQSALNEARALYDAAKKSLGKDTTTLLEYAEVLRYGGDHDLAAEILKRVTRLAPDNADAWLQLGDALSRCGPTRARDAESALRKAISLATAPVDVARAHAALGGWYRREGLYDLARENLDKAAQTDPANAGAKIGLAALNAREGRVREAEDLLNGLGAVAPEAGQLMESALKDALDDFQRSRRLIPDTAADHLAYAKLLFRAGRIQETAGPLERSVKLDPNNVVAWNLLGSVSRYLNDTARAREAFTRSLALRPDDVKTQEALKELDAAPVAQGPAPSGGSGQ
ncbi:MAG: tetratricopeptide repeat protein [Candidatus Hydrogenedentes bacterium]|nr:tetratricopeptide repeat protein [Candidatus Hydrogenedentota bacterium]